MIIFRRGRVSLSEGRPRLVSHKNSSSSDGLFENCVCVLLGRFFGALQRRNTHFSAFSCDPCSDGSRTAFCICPSIWHVFVTGAKKFLKKFLDIRQLLSYILCYHDGMDITAYWLNHKRRDAGEGKVYYFYPYTRCEKDDTPTLFIGGKHYIRIAVSEEEWARLRKLDDKEYNSERRAHNKRWTADIPRLRDEDGEEIDFWSDRAEDRETRYIEGDICEESDRRALVRSFDKIDRRIYRLDRKDFTQQEIARRLHLDQATVSRRLE